MVTTEQMEGAMRAVERVTARILQLQRERDIGRFDRLEWGKTLLEWSIATRMFKKLVKDGMFDVGLSGTRPRGP